jgi:hypothetical protein
MSDMTPTPQFEDEVRAAVAAPQARAEFVNGLHARLVQQAASKPGKLNRPVFLRPAWVVTFAIAVLLVGILLLGPQRVVAAMRSLVGYLPEVGIVDQSAPIRVLAEPVSLTKDGVTVRVTQAILTGDRTHIVYQVFGVPRSAYPESEAVSGCVSSALLRLPDGTKLEIADNMPPVPANVSEATFILPCIWNTLPGTVPENWELPLRFVPAPPDLTVMPVMEVTPSGQTTIEPVNETPVQETESTTTATSTPSTAIVSVERVIETEDGYILIGNVRAQIPQGSWLQVTGPAIIQDAAGKRVSYSFPNDVQPDNDASLGQGGFAWAIRIKGAGVTFPLTISYSGVIISQVDPQASARIAFDAGPNPQPDQVWTLNQDIQLAGSTVRLISITAYADGYSFQIDPGPNLSGVSIQIDGYQASGGGGGGAWGGKFNTSLIFSELPKGSLTILLTNPLTASAGETWRGQWQPDAPRAFATDPSTGSSAVCLNADTFQALKPLPTGLDGSMLMTELNPALQTVLVSFDGSQRQVLAPGKSRGALTADGARLAYPDDRGIVLLDVSNQSTSVLTSKPGYDLHWSPDGTRLAFVNPGEQPGIWVIGADGANPRRLSEFGFETIAGWSPDGERLYYETPDSGGNGWLFKAVDVNTGAVEDLFILENASRKAPMPALSPDGKWIAYRAGDNSSLYLIRTDGTQPRLVMDQPAAATSGFAWEKQGHLLAVSLVTPENPDGVVVLLQIDPCEAYNLPGLHGEVEGILIP